MRMASAPTAAKVDALLTVLDEDIRHTQTSLSLLDALRSMLIKRDDVALERLLNDLRREAEVHLANERRRQNVRQELADEMGCAVQSVTLSVLKDRLSGDRQAAVVERQMRLKSLTAELKREHALTTMLVADCARFNRSLIRMFFGLDGKGKMTYGANGTAKHQAGTALVNLHL
jgi:hypothetical protein